jgi:uncharacterized metal-binding protein YceD (DUF177 family)
LQPDFQNAVVMDVFVAYSIPIQGLKYGVHHFQYSVDKAFYSHFEGSPVEDGEVQFKLQLDKRSDMFLLDFELEGSVGADCDRCTAPIRLPIADERQLVVKYGDADGEAEDEVVFISREAPNLNVAKYLYEFTVLALPIINAYEGCALENPPPCNFDVLKMLQQSENQLDNPGWDALKNFKENP